MADNKGKTKAAILHELESIKGLLLEDDEIPILQETIADRAPGSDRPLPKRDLDELHDVFQALSHNIRNAAGKIGAPTPPARPSGLLDALVHPQNRTSPIKPEATGKQASLFGDTRPGDSQLNDKKFSDSKPDKTASDADEDYLDQATVDPTEEPNEKWKEAAFDQPLNYAVNKSITPPPRPALAKASGENPFLPQHIRARLHGNNPPPLFDPATAEKPMAVKASKPAEEPFNRQQLIREVTAAVMPQIEQELRQRLHALTDEQLQDLLNDPD
ncbi:hypothetical protein ACSV5M_06820 [Cellvibrio sp. ARAG 10.3]|uniref:hypothetical protein n=1 Tax=Cellvibrio sp. ARAG 10.3 TaxID=3451358 RepID=UPI003F447BBF